MPGTLLRFKKSEIVLNEQEATVVLKFFFTTTPGKLNDEDRGFAQGLLIEALDASYKVGFVEDLLRSVVKLPKGVVAVIKTFAKKATVRWFKHAKKRDILDDPKIYKMVKDRLTLNFRSVWLIRMDGGGLTY